jgi:hypothetical protein
VHVLDLEDIDLDTSSRQVPGERIANDVLPGKLTSDHHQAPIA